MRMAASVGRSFRRRGARLPLSPLRTTPHGPRRAPHAGRGQGVHRRGRRPGRRLPAVRLAARDRARPRRPGPQRGRAGGDPRLPGAPAALDAFVRRLQSDAPPRARVERVTVTPLDAATRRDAGSAVRDRRERRRGRRRAPLPAGHRHLRRLPARAVRPGRPALPLPVHQLHQLRARGPRSSTSCPTTGPSTTMRGLPALPGLRRGVRGPGEPALPRRAGRLPGLRAAPGLPADRAPRRRDALGEDALSPPPVDLAARGGIVAVKGLGGYHLACDATDEVGRPAACATASAAGPSRSRSWSATSPRPSGSPGSGPPSAPCSPGPARPIVLLVARRPRASRGWRLGRDRQPAARRLPALHAAPPPAARRRSAGRSCSPPATCPTSRWPPTTPTRSTGWPALADALPRPRPRDPGPLRRLGHAGSWPGARVDRPARPRLRPRRRCRCRSRRPAPILAVGAELKHTFTLARGRRAHVAPHNGDLEDLPTHRAFTDGLAHLSRLLALEPEVVAHDLHPEYLSTKYAVERFPADAADRGPAPPRPRRLVRGRARHHRPVHRRRLRRPRDGRRRHVLGRRDPRSPTCRLSADRAIRSGADAGRRARGQAALPDGARLPPRRRAAVGEPGRRRGGRHRPGPRRPRRRRSWPGSIPREVACRPDPGRARGSTRRWRRRPGGSSTPPPRCSACATWPSTRPRRRSTSRSPPDDRLGRAAAVPDGRGRRAPRLRPAARRCARSSRASPPAAPRPASRRRSTRRSPRSPRELLAGAGRRRRLRTVCLSGGVFQNRRLASTLLRRLARDGFEVFINRQVPVNDGGISYGQAAIAAARLAAATRRRRPSPPRRTR